MNDVATTPLTFLVHHSRLTDGHWNGETIAGQGDICASYSADRISENKPVRAPFQWQGSLWTCIGMMGRGGVQEYACAYRLLPEERFDGAPTNFAERTAGEELCEAARNDPMGFYHGVFIQHKGQRFVLCGPEARFTADKNVSENTPISGQQLSLF
jgi:hypothetical protein